MQFLDQAKILVKAGDGGNGCMAFRREKFVPRGGPSGGDGGRGGDITLVAAAHHNTLLQFSFNPEHKAERGRHGLGSNRSGADGASIDVPVPVGTVVYDEATGEKLFDFTEVGQRFVVARGGKGGRGNQHFATPTHQAPTEHEPGRPGEERRLRLELKLLADVGLVGFPNAGKSTLISRISAARPKIADYPFTTLEPNLGVVQLPDWKSFVVADIPGLIEGAHEGHGLGIQFLRHIERTRLLAFLIPIDAMDWQAEYDQLRREIAEYSPDLAAKPHCVVFTKMDLLGEEYAPPIQAPGAFGLFAISAAAREGLDALTAAWWTELLRLKQSVKPEDATVSLP